VEHVGVVFAIDDDYRALRVFDDGPAELERSASMVGRFNGFKTLKAFKAFI
jgi:hypothetical protein